MIQGLFGDVLANSPLASYIAGGSSSYGGHGRGDTGGGGGGNVDYGSQSTGGAVDWSKQPGVMANVDWSTLKPFQVMPQSFVGSPYQQMPMNAEEAKAKLDSTPTTDTRSEYQKWLDSQSQSRGERSGRDDRTGGTAGNGTNLSDEQWAAVKSMRDEAGGWSDYDRANWKGMGGLLGGIAGMPLGGGGISSFNDASNILNQRVNQTYYGQEQQNQRAAEAAAMAQQQRQAEAAAAQRAAPSGLRSAPVGLSPDQMSAAQKAAMVADMTRATAPTRERSDSSRERTTHQSEPTANRNRGY